MPDVVAVGDDQESQGKWLERNNIKVDNRIKLKKLSHMRYQHPDLDELHKFMIDFGMEVAKKTDDEVWFRGYGPDQYVYYARKGPKKFLGGAFVAETREDFERWDPAYLPTTECRG